MDESNLIGNDNWQLDGKPPIALVDNLAKELCQDYDNFAFFKWYCLVINILGITRIEDIRDRCKDSKHKGQLFSRYAGEEAKQKVGLDRYQKLKGQYGRRP
jgi:hypothetical protein